MLSVPRHQDMGPKEFQNQEWKSFRTTRHWTRKIHWFSKICKVHPQRLTVRSRASMCTRKPWQSFWSCVSRRVQLTGWRSATPGGLLRCPTRRTCKLDGSWKIQTRLTTGRELLTDRDAFLFRRSPPCMTLLQTSE